MDNREIMEIIRHIEQRRRALAADDIRDAEVHMHPTTIAQTAAVLCPMPALDNSPLDSILGMPLREDRNLPLGTAMVVAENEMDRAIRRAARDGIMTWIPDPPAIDWASFPPSATPTIKALLRHWVRKIKQRVKR